jgi:hypothetical protein
MNAHEATIRGSDDVVEAFAAELTQAAYPVALRHGAGEAWLDLELDLWRALADTIKKWVPESSRAAVPPDVVSGNVRARLDHRRQARLSLAK